MPRSSYRRELLFAAVACALLSATGCRSICCDTACDAEPEPARERSLQRRPLAGRLAAFQAKCADHFAEEPAVAPHPRFHPVPTRPVFAPIPPEELAVLVAPPEAAGESAHPSEEKPASASPPAIQDAPAATPDRTAHASGDETGAEASVVHSIFVPTPPEVDHSATDAPIGPFAVETLLWRAIPTPAGSLRAVPTDELAR